MSCGQWEPVLRHVGTLNISGYASLCKTPNDGAYHSNNKIGNTMKVFSGPSHKLKRSCDCIHLQGHAQSIIKSVIANPLLEIVN